MELDDDRLLRYSRQIMLPQVDAAGQQRLLDSHALVIGVGGLGSPAALYLAAAGVGRLTLLDHDRVELSNLQRQILHGTPDLGRPKVDSARDRLRHIDPELDLHTLDHRLEGAALTEACREADVVLDCTDGFEARHGINRACLESGTPLVSAAVIRMEGQLAVFDPRDPEAPCYACLYPEQGEDPPGTCSENGVLAPVAGLLGCLQATEAIKLLLGLPVLRGELLLVDALQMQFRRMRLPRDPACPVCAHRPAA